MALTEAEIKRRYRARKRGEFVEPMPPHGRPPVISIQAGQRFARLTVIRELPGSPRRAECACDCGRLTTALVKLVARGTTRSCGCLQRERTATHGLYRHPLYETWKAIRHRCENPRHHAFMRYGGRGITVSAEWHDVAAFITWIESNLGPRPDGMTLDRINNDGHYEPGNVRWATRSEQQKNKRPQLRHQGRPGPGQLLPQGEEVTGVGNSKGSKGGSDGKGSSTGKDYPPSYLGSPWAKSPKGGSGKGGKGK